MINFDLPPEEFQRRLNEVKPGHDRACARCGKEYRSFSPWYACKSGAHHLLCHDCFIAAQFRAMGPSALQLSDSPEAVLQVLGNLGQPRRGPCPCGAEVEQVLFCEECGQPVPAQAVVTRSVRNRARDRHQFVPGSPLRAQRVATTPRYETKQFCSGACVRTWIHRKRVAEHDTLMDNLLALGLRAALLVAVLGVCSAGAYLVGGWSLVALLAISGVACFFARLLHRSP